MSKKPCNCRKANVPIDRQTVSKYGWSFSRKGYGDVTLELKINNKVYCLLEGDFLSDNDYFLQLEFDQHFSSVFRNEIESSNLSKVLQLERGRAIRYSGSASLARWLNILKYVSKLVERLLL